VCLTSCVRVLRAHRVYAHSVTLPLTSPPPPPSFFLLPLHHPLQVIAVGPGKADEDGKVATPPSLTVGSTVLYSKYAGTELKNPRVEEEYVVISAADVLATVA
jgi:hypothetical protein